VSSGNGSHDSSGHARPPDDVQHIGKYRLIKTIGRGNFAKVKMAKHVPTGRQVMKCKFQWHHNKVSFGLLQLAADVAYFSDFHCYQVISGDENLVMWSKSE